VSSAFYGVFDKEEIGMALRDFLKGATEIGRAMGVTLKALTEKPVTTEYPRDPAPLYPRFRGKHELRRYENGMERCIGCMLCEAACPTGAIYVEATENDPQHPTSPGERYAKVYDCEEACPTEAIVLGHEFALANYNRRDFILTKQELLNPGEPNIVIRPE
jgi:NADH-quinone oxidoreductase subunit I